MRILFGPAHDGPHIAPDEPGAYEWWYFDALSDDGRWALVAIWFHGSPMSPYYKAVVDGRAPLPHDWCGVFFSLHEKVGGRWRERAYAYNLYRGGTFAGDGARSLEVAVGGSRVSLAPSPSSSLRDGAGGTVALAPLLGSEHDGSSSPPPSRSDDEGEGPGERASLCAYHLTVDEPGLWLGGTRAELTFALPEGGAPLDLPPMGDKGDSPEHSWVCVAPVCRVTGAVTLANGKRVEFTGDGYHDHNFGRLPWTDTDIWYWGRGSVSAFKDPERRTAVFYSVMAPSEELVSTLLLFDAAGAAVAVAEEARSTTEGATIRNAYGLRHAAGLLLRDAILMFKRAHRDFRITAEFADPRSVIAEGPFYRRMVSPLQVSLRSGRGYFAGDGQGTAEVFRPSRLCGPIASRAMWTRIRRRSWGGAGTGGAEPEPTMSTTFSRREAVGGAALAELPDGGLSVSVPADTTHAGVRFSFEGPNADWSAAQSLVFTLRANGAHRMRLHFEHGNGVWTLYLVPRPGLTSRVVIPFEDLLQRAPNTNHPGYSRFGGGPQPVALGDVRTVTVTFNQVSPEDKRAELTDLALTPDVPEAAVLDPRPVVDAWGQWTGERGAPRTEQEIRATWDSEPTAFAGFPGHTDATGADANAARRHKPSGFFRVAQDPGTGRWELIDPDGLPFFSVGCDCVRAASEGPVGGKEALFADLSGAHPSPRAERGGRWENPLWADFYQQNLRRRYAAHGDSWRDAWSEQVATRLRGWGFNTIANWSDADLTRRGRIPYVTNLTSLSGMCDHLPDVFEPGFAGRVRDLVAPEVAPYRGDRTLIGFFVGNEPKWTFGGYRHPFNEILVSDEYPHTRRQAISDLQTNYRGDVGVLNHDWKTDFAGWDDLTRPGAVPDVRLGTDALKSAADEFLGKVLGEFYEVCCREIRAVDPDHLLLGGRFYSPSLAEPYVRACRPFDVYSFNFYNWNPPREAIERAHRLCGLPVLVGEFHYGVEGRGLTASLVGAASQDDRGLAYRHFVEGVAALPQVVGCHWFQWADQPVTGRFDGECYNIGLVDIADCPYEGFLAHVRTTHERLYDLRRGAAEPYVFPNARPAAW